MSFLITMSQKELHRLEVIEKIHDRRLSVVQAAGVLGISRSQMHRLLKAYEIDGMPGLVSKKRQQPSNRRHSEDLRNAVLDLVRERYADFGPTLAREKLIERHQLAIGKETLRQWMTEAGIWISRSERKNVSFNHAVGAIALASWCRSMDRITGGSRTADQNAPFSSISMTLPASCYICALRDPRTLSIICTRQRPICSNGASRWLFIATSTACFALRTLRRKIEPVG